MDTNKFEQYLKKRYEDQVDWYDRKSLDNQNKYKWFQFALIVFSALTPVLIALTFGYEDIEVVKWIPIGTSVIVAILASTLKTFKYHEHWINYRTTCETLKKEYHFFEANVGDYTDTVDKQALFVERTEALISRENTFWIESCKENKHRGT